MAKISDESVRRSKGVNLPGGIPQKDNNSITGDLSSIIENIAKDINNHIDKIYSGIDAIFDSLVDPSQLLLSESDKSLMSFVSGGQSISKNQSYSSKQTNIQQFAKSISENLKKTNKILTSDGMQVIVTNFNEQKLKKEKPQNVEVKVPEIKPVINIPDYSKQLDILRFTIENSNKIASDNIIKVLTNKNEIKEKQQNVEVKPIINMPDYTEKLGMIEFTIDNSNYGAADKIVEALQKFNKSNINSQFDNFVKTVNISDMSIVKYFNYLKSIFKDTEFKIKNNVVQNNSSNSSSISSNTYTIKFTDGKVFEDMTTLINSIATGDGKQLAIELKKGNIGDVIYSIIEPIARIGKQKFNNDGLNNINTIVKHVQTIMSSIKDLKLPKGQKIVDISAIFDSILKLGEYDKSKAKTMGKGLRKILWMVEKPDVLTSIGVWDRGLISKIIQNVIDRAAEAKKVEGSSLDDLNTFFETLSKVGTDSFNYDDIQKTYESLSDVATMYAAKGPIINLISNILELDDNTIKVDIEKLGQLKSLIVACTTITSGMTIKDIMKNSIKMQAAVISASIGFAIYKILDNLNENKLNEQIKNVGKLQELIATFSNIGMWSIQEATKVSFEMAKFAMIISIAGLFAKNADNNIDNITTLAKKSSKTLEEIQKAVSSVTSDKDLVLHLQLMRDALSTMNTIALVSSIGAVLAPLGLLGLYSMKIEAKILKGIVDKLNEIKVDDNLVKNLKDLTKVLAITSGIMLVGSLIGKLISIPDILSFIIGLGLFIAGTIKAYSFASKDIDETIIDAEKFVKLIGISGAIMLVGASIMMIPNMFGHSLLFNMALSAFIIGTIGAYKFASKDMKGALIDAEQFGNLIGISAVVLMFPALLMSIIPDLASNVAIFTGLLGAFIVGTLGIFSYINKIDPGLSKSMNAAQRFSVLVGISALSLSIGAFAEKTYGWHVLGFAVTLTAFIAGVTAAYLFVGKYLNSGDALKDANGFAMLVAISATTMLIGAFISEKSGGLMLSSLRFAIGLGAFIFLISGAYALASILLGGGKGIQNAEDLGMIIAISAATMLIGGAFMMIDGMPIAVLKFTVLLGVFVGGILAIYGFAAKNFNSKTKAAMIGLTALIIGSAAVLLIGGGLMMVYPQLFGSTMQFLLCTALMVGGMSLIVFALTKIGMKNIAIGELALAGIEALILSAAAILGYINSLNLNYDNIIDSLKMMGIAIGATTAVVFILGSIASNGYVAIALAAGAAVLAGIEALILGAGKALTSIAMAMQEFNKVKPIKSDVITGNIGEFLKIFGAMMPLMNPFLSLLLNTASATVVRLSFALSLMSHAVKSYADLKVPIYDGTKIVGYRKIEKSDFDEAGTNVGLIITTLGNAIIELYQNDKNGMFGNFASEFLRVDNPFTRVVKSCLGLGRMLSVIARSVKDYADLKVPIYEGTNVVGYRGLNETDFTNAANNVRTIIETLGQAIITTYQNAPVGMFTDPSVWHTSADKTPFGMTVKACTGMGNMISGIAKAVKDVAELRMPIYNKDGKLAGYREMKPEDFTNAGTNINTIITTLANSIIATYNTNKSMFGDPSKWHTSADKTPFGMTVKAMGGIGQLISGAVKAIQDVANLKIQAYDKNGNLIEGKYRIIKQGDLGSKGRIYQNIMAIMSVLPAAIMQTYNGHKEWFTDESFWHTDAQKTPFGMVKQCLTGIDKLFSSVVASIKGMLDMKLTQAQFDALGDQVYKVFSALPNAIVKSCFDEKTNKIKTIYEDISWTEDVKEAFNNYSDVIKICDNSYTNILKLLSKFDKNIDMGVLGRSIARMVATIPHAFTSAYNNNKAIISNTDTVNQISEAFEMFNDAINRMTRVYNKILGLKKKITVDDKLSFEGSIGVMNKGIDKMFESITSINKIDDNLVNKLLNDFQGAMMQYNMGMSELFDVYDKAPKDTSKYDNVINAVKGINVEISKVKNTSQFRTETQDVSKFTRSINTLDVAKAQTMTNLITALDQMARRLGGLDKLTNTLANKLAVVLDKLVRELKISAKTINQADEMQKKRHAAIKDSISKISTLLNKPVEVNVKQVQDTENPNMQYSDTSTGNGQNSAERDETPAGDNPLNSKTQSSE